jgi:hypothetical protein
MNGHRLTATPLLLALAACVPSASQPPSDFARLPACDQVRALIAEHASGFPSLRGAHTGTRYGDIWNARHDVVGKGCEIWRAGSGATHYVCTRTAPDETTADLHYQRDRALLRGCLGPAWREREKPLESGAGVRTIFSDADTPAAISIHKLHSRGGLRTQWTIYYLVGEPTDRL